MKVVCLHGWGISPKFMEMQTKELRRALPQLEMVFLEAPYDVPPVYIQDEKVKKYSPDNKFKTWKHAITEDLLVQKKVDFSKSVEVLVDFIKENGEVDGILAFSMGGFVVQQFFEKLENGEIDLKYHPRFAMFVSVTYDKYIPKLMKTPSVHTVGTRDELMFGANLLNSMRFLKPLVLVHSEGHKFPRLNQNDIDNLNAFLKPIQQSKINDSKRKTAEKELLQQRPSL